MMPLAMGTSLATPAGIVGVASVPALVDAGLVLAPIGWALVAFAVAVLAALLGAALREGRARRGAPGILLRRSARAGAAVTPNSSVAVAALLVLLAGPGSQSPQDPRDVARRVQHADDFDGPRRHPVEDEEPPKSRHRPDTHGGGAARRRTSAPRSQGGRGSARTRARRRWHTDAQRPAVLRRCRQPDR
jgi:hypothetical protein